MCYQEEPRWWTSLISEPVITFLHCIHSELLLIGSSPWKKNPHHSALVWHWEMWWSYNIEKECFFLFSCLLQISSDLKDFLAEQFCSLVLISYIKQALFPKKYVLGSWLLRNAALEWRSDASDTCRQPDSPFYMYRIQAKPTKQSRLLSIFIAAALKFLVFLVSLIPDMLANLARAKGKVMVGLEGKNLIKQIL